MIRKVIIAYIMSTLFVYIVSSNGVLPFTVLCKTTVADIIDTRWSEVDDESGVWYCTVSFEDKGKTRTAELKYNSVTGRKYTRGYEPLDRVLIRYRKTIFDKYKAARQIHVGYTHIVSNFAGLLVVLVCMYCGGDKRYIKKKKVNLR